VDNHLFKKGKTHKTRPHADISRQKINDTYAKTEVDNRREKTLQGKCRLLS
jgi:hypothetical protein